MQLPWSPHHLPREQARDPPRPNREAVRHAGRGLGSPGPRSWAVSAIHLSGTMCRCAERKTNKNTLLSATGICGGGGLHRVPAAGGMGEGTAAERREGELRRPARRRGTLPPWVAAGSTRAAAKGAGRLSCTPPAPPPSLCPPAFPGGRWGAQRGWGAPGLGAGLSRAPHPRHCGGSSNQSAPGGSSWAGTTRLRGVGWAAVT